MLEKKVLIATYNRYPDGDAGAVRQAVFRKMFQELGYSVFVIGMGDLINNSLEDNIPDFTSFRNEKSGILPKIDNYFGYKRKLKKWLENNPRQDVIMVVDLPINAMNYLKKYAEKNGSILLHDSVEWYSPEEFQHGKLSIDYIRKDFRNKYYFTRKWKIVAISTYLQNHFSSKGLKTIRIPAIMDVNESAIDKFIFSEKTIIVYAGSPGTKDCFDTIIRAFLQLPKDYLERVELRIIGVNESQFLRLNNISSDNWKELKNHIILYGRIPREKVIEELRKANYTILLRHSEMRYAKAGFSTKIPESLSQYVPVICNLSSDLHLYLHDGKNAIVVDNNDQEAVKRAIMRAIDTPVTDQKIMRMNAFNTAKMEFNWQTYLPDLKSILDS